MKTPKPLQLVTQSRSRRKFMQFKGGLPDRTTRELHILSDHLSDCLAAVHATIITREMEANSETTSHNTQ